MEKELTCSWCTTDTHNRLPAWKKDINDKNVNILLLNSPRTLSVSC